MNRSRAPQEAKTLPCVNVRALMCVQRSLGFRWLLSLNPGRNTFCRTRTNVPRKNNSLCPYLLWGQLPRDALLASVEQRAKVNRIILRSLLWPWERPGACQPTGFPCGAQGLLYGPFPSLSLPLLPGPKGLAQNFARRGLRSEWTWRRTPTMGLGFQF